MAGQRRSALRRLALSFLAALAALGLQVAYPSAAAPGSARSSAAAYAVPLGSSAPAVRAAYGCSWGTATTAICPQVHWADNGYPRPQVYFVDRASSAWPVAAAAATWNRASYLDAYAVRSCPGYRGTHCVTVYDANFGRSGWVGYTSYSWDGVNNLIDGSVTIYLNDYYGLNAYGHRQSVCHEMGHALGLGHDSSASSCLYPDILNSAYLQQPGGYDFALLNSIYSLVH